jgi:tRNA (adenine57-N1/adenine58-N1)-methyltransferase
VVPHATEALRPGGILVAYTPSITQAMQTREAMANKMWNGVRTLEVLHRGWYIEGQAVRPDHRMVAHTAFLTVGRFLGKPEQS